MTSSRSKAWKSSWLAWIVCLVIIGVGAAQAGNRKRVVVLDFDGPKAEKFHDEVVKLLKKSNTVVSTDKWNSAAEELDASKVTEKNVKKVAKKLKIDGIITGKIEKRRDEYIVQIKLRAGGTGEIVGNRIDTKADGPELDGKAARDVKEQLIGAIEELEANHGGEEADDADAKPKHKKTADDAADDADAKPKHGGFVKKADDAAADDADAKPKHKKADDAATDDADAKPKHKKADDAAADDADAKPKHKKADDADADDADAKPRHKKADDVADDDSRPKKHKKADDDGGDDTPHHKKHASADDDDSVSAHADEPLSPEAALTPGNRAVDFVIGMSFTARRLSFSSIPSLTNAPPSYKQTLPVAGGIMDATVYPLAFTHKDTGPLTGLGIEIMYDKVIHINSSKQYVDSTTMAQITANLPTVEQRFSFGGVFRYPMGAAVIGGKLLYSNQQFSVQQTINSTPPMPTDIPNVDYTMVEPKAFLKYTVNPQIIVNVDAGFMLVTSTGAISKESTDGGYGPNKVSGYEASAGIDYTLTKNLFVRAEARLESISLTFKGDPNSLANNRNSDPAQDVNGAKDLYFGGMATIGYIY